MSVIDYTLSTMTLRTRNADDSTSDKPDAVLQCHPLFRIASAYIAALSCMKEGAIEVVKDLWACYMCSKASQYISDNCETRLPNLNSISTQRVGEETPRNTRHVAKMGVTA